MFFICNKNLVEDFRTMFGDVFAYADRHSSAAVGTPPRSGADSTRRLRYHEVTHRGLGER